MDPPMPSPTTGPRHRKARLSCRRIDRLFCNFLCYFPLLFIFGVSTWAVYTYSYSICWNSIDGLKGPLLNLLGLTLYLLLNWSYFTAVFTNPGSPLDNKHAYSSLSTTESTTESSSSITVKSSGQVRFCKKCQCYKPDRTHHCSSCKTCVLKMDHHCPWLANCLGMYNYKAFLLFLIYTSIFCIVCFVLSSAYVYEELLSSNARDKVDDFTPVNWVLLAVISGIIGLVLSGFTIWHLTLVGSGMTTIESLEKARYTTPTLSRSGVPPPPGAHHLYDNPDNGPSYDYAGEREQEREQEFRRYNAYVLEESTKRLPHPFDLGKARNFRAVFGPREEWWMWFIPWFSGVGDGWIWETSNEWRVAAEAMRVERERIAVEQGERESRVGLARDENRHPAAGRTWNGGNPNGLVRHAGEMRPSKAERILGKIPGTYSDGENVPLQRMNRAAGDMSSDEEDGAGDERTDLEAGLAAGRRAKMEPRSAGTGSVRWGSWGRDEGGERW